MELELFEPIELETFYHNDNRYYILPRSEVAVPSVTSVLYKDVHFEENPASISARRRGTAVHDLVEAYFKTGSYPNGAMPVNIELANKIVDQCVKHLNKLHLCENCLFSERMLTAGRVDAVGEWDGQLAVIDFKTSKYAKKEEWIWNYRLQTMAYALMAKDNYRLTMPIQSVIIIANDQDAEAQVFNFSHDQKVYDEVMKKFIWDRYDYHHTQYKTAEYQAETVDTCRELFCGENDDEKIDQQTKC